MANPGDRASRDTLIFAAIKDAIHFREMNESGLAVELLTPLAAEFPEEPSIHAYLAWCLYDDERFTEAIEHGRLATHLRPRNELASLVLFHALWNSGNRSEAIEEIKRFLPLRRSESKTPQYAEILRKWESGDKGGEYVRRRRQIFRA